MYEKTENEKRLVKWEKTNYFRNKSAAKRKGGISSTKRERADFICLNDR